MPEWLIEDGIGETRALLVEALAHPIGNLRKEAAILQDGAADREAVRTGQPAGDAFADMEIGTVAVSPEIGAVGDADAQQSVICHICFVKLRHNALVICSKC